MAYRWDFFAGVGLLILTNLLGVSIPVQVQQVIDRLDDPNITSLDEFLAAKLGLIFGLALVMLGVRIYSRQFLLGIGRKVEYALRNRLYQHLLTLPPSYYTAHPTGELMSRMINDVQALRYLFGGGTLLGFNTVFAYLITLPVMIYYSPRLTLFAFLILPIAVFLMSIVSGRVKSFYFKVQEILGEVSTVAQENFSGMAVIQSYVKEDSENRRFAAISNDYFRAFRDLIHQRVWLFLIMAGVSSIGILIILAEGGHEFISGQISYGVFVAFVLLLERLSWPTAAMGWTVTMIQQGTAAMERIDQVLCAQNILESPEEAEHYDSGLPLGALEIRHLDFHYTNPYLQWAGVAGKAQGQESPVLRDISLTLEPGETVVIVGPVGCGKSTLLSLIPRLYPIKDGHIDIGGRDINRVPLARLRETVTLMPQHSFLFSSTIDRNIAYGDPQAERERITAAAETAALHEEILSFESGYDTVVGERGITLSGGQRQRMALARAILVTPRILLLDDPFSNVDAETEQAIISALDARHVLENKMTLIASHRLSIIQKADRVVLMDQGRIVASGSHEELMATQPLYRRLHRLEHLRAQLDAVWHDQNEEDVS